MRELGEESVESNDNVQCASVDIYMYIYIRSSTIAVRFFSQRDMYIFVHSYIHHAIFFLSFFLFLLFFLILTLCTIRRQMSSKVACLEGNVI